jgi:hypothetical protein
MTNSACRASAGSASGRASHSQTAPVNCKGVYPVLPHRPSSLCEPRRISSKLSSSGLR